VSLTSIVASIELWPTFKKLEETGRPVPW